MAAETGDLFAPRADEAARRRLVPLAERLRPRTLDEVVGQRRLLAPGAPLRALLDADELPSLILWGDQDDIIPVEHAHAAHARMPGSRLEIFEGAGHFLHVERPAEFAAALRDFIESTEASTPDPQAFRELVRTGAVTETGLEPSP